MKKTLFSTLCVAIILLAGCTVNYGIHVGTDGVGVTGNRNGDAVQLMLLGGPSPVPKGFTLDRPVEMGNTNVLFETKTKVGTNAPQVEWLVDRQLVGRTGVQQQITIRNTGDGTHEVLAIIYRSTAGDNRSAGSDTLSFRTHTYTSDGTSGLRMIDHNPETFRHVSDGSTIALPNSFGDLLMTYRVSSTISKDRFVAEVDWYLNHQLVGRRSAGEIFPYRNTVDGMHDAMAIVYWLKAGDRSPAGVDTLNFHIDMSVDVYPR